MKKIFLVLVFIFAFTLTSYATQELSLVAENKTASPGESVEIALRLENNPGIIAALFSVDYDRQRLVLEEARDTYLLESGVFSPDYDAIPYKMVWNSAGVENCTRNGELVVLTFRVLDNASAGKAYINITYNENDVFDVDLKNVPVKIVNGSIDVEKVQSSSNNSVSASSGSSRPSSSGSSAVNREKNQIILTIGKKEAKVFGVEKVNDVAPLAVNERTMLPARFVAENLGAEVLWDKSEPEIVVITKGKTKIIVRLNDEYAEVNGKKVKLDSPAFATDNRTYTPVRFICEALGAKVEWVQKSQQVIITKQN